MSEPEVVHGLLGLTTFVSEARITAFLKPWKVDLQSIVDAIDQTFADIKDISYFHGLLESHASLGLGGKNLRNTEKSVKMHEESLERLSGLEQMLQQVHAMVVSFSKEGDVQQTANLLRQCVNETLQEPEQSRKSRGQDEAIPGRYPHVTQILRDSNGYRA